MVSQVVENALFVRGKPCRESSCVNHLDVKRSLELLQCICVIQHAYVGRKIKHDNARNMISARAINVGSRHCLLLTRGQRQPCTANRCSAQHIAASYNAVFDWPRWSNLCPCNVAQFMRVLLQYIRHHLNAELRPVAECSGRPRGRKGLRRHWQAQ